MLCLCKDLLTDNAKVLKKCRNKYRYIMCDEYQDTNQIQIEILYLLAGKNGNICVVGDDDQSIYEFRGALPVIMMDLKKRFSESVGNIYGYQLPLQAENHCSSW